MQFILSVHQFQFLFGRVNHGAEFVLFVFRQGDNPFGTQRTIGEKNVCDPSLYTPRSIPEDMEERFMFAMQVRHEMFCWFWQVQDGFKVDNFRCNRGNVRKFACKKLQIAKVFLGGFGTFHILFVEIW